MTTRKMARSTLGWAFGMAVSILFLSLWGRAVVADTDSLAESLTPLSDSETVVDFVADWMGEEMIDSGADPALVVPTIDYFLESSSIGEALDRLVADVVAAAASRDPDGSTVDMSALLYPAVPEVTAELNGLGYQVSETEVREAVEELDPLVIRLPGTRTVVGPSSRTAIRLGTASLLAALAMAVFASGVIALSGDRVKAIRELLNRVAVGGLGFAVFLRVGSWVLDPRGGRAPIRSSLSYLAASKWAVPLQIAAAAAVVAGAMYVWRRYLRRGEASRPGDEPPRPREERQPSLSR